MTCDCNEYVQDVEVDRTLGVEVSEVIRSTTTYHDAFRRNPQDSSDFACFAFAQ